MKIYLRSTTKAMADGEKEGKTKTQKFEYLKNKISFLDEIKDILYSFGRTIIWRKIKFDKK